MHRHRRKYIELCVESHRFCKSTLNILNFDFNNDYYYVQNDGILFISTDIEMKIDRMETDITITY